MEHLGARLSLYISGWNIMINHYFIWDVYLYIYIWLWISTICLGFTIWIALWWPFTMYIIMGVIQFINYIWKFYSESSPNGCIFTATFTIQPDKRWFGVIVGGTYRDDWNLHLHGGFIEMLATASKPCGKIWGDHWNVMGYLPPKSRKNAGYLRLAIESIPIINYSRARTS